MARKAREMFETEFFHIIVQGLNREKIFLSSHFKEVYLKKLQEEKEAFGVHILAYCVMDNHCHLLLHVEDVKKLSRYMLKVNTMYAQYYNFMENRVGFVFRDRFKSQPIFEEEYLAYCLIYIQNNPVKAGIVVDPLQYGFSSYKDYKKQSGMVDFEEAAKYFDTSAKNISYLMTNVDGDDCDMEWIEVKSDEKTPAQKAAKILKKYPVPAQYLKASPSLFKQAIAEMAAAGMKKIEIAQVFGVTPQYISKIAAK